MIRRSDFPQLSLATWNAIEERVRAFEAAWLEGVDRPSIRDFLTLPSVPREPLLVELIHTELEFRILDGEPVCVEDYVEEFPELQVNPAVLAGLLLTEYRMRLPREPGLKLDALTERFPDCRDLVLQQNNSFSWVGESWAGCWHDAVASNQMPEIPGYRMETELGRGGMGVVYRARDTQLERTVAIKVMLNGNLASPNELARFRREVQTAARLQHPHVLPIYQVGQEAGWTYAVLEYAPGGSLADRLTGQPLPPAEAARLMRQLAGAVGKAHELGVIHRDLKPGNILLMTDGTPKVADFGLAKRPGSESEVTHSAMLMGTPCYMAPEQARVAETQVGPAADIYAMGAILYELLTGRPPLRGATVLDTLELVRATDPVAPRALVPAIPPDLETVCLKCLEKEPGQRYGSADELAEDLRRFLNHEPVTARPLGVFGRIARWTRRNRRLAALAATIALLLLAVSAGSVLVAVWMADAREIERQLRVNAETATRQANEARRVAGQAERTARENEQRATREAEIARQTTQFLENLFRSANVTGLGNLGFRVADARAGANLSARDVVLLGVDRLKEQLHDQPHVRAQLLAAVGETAFNLGMLHEARALLREAVELRRTVGALDDPVGAEALSTLGMIEMQRGDLEQSANLLEQALAIQRRHYGADDLRVATTETMRGFLAVSSTRSQGDGLDWLKHAADVRRRRLGPLSPETKFTEMLLYEAQSQNERDFRKSAERLYALAAEVEADPRSAVLRAKILHFAAHASQRVQDNDAATRAITTAIDIMRRELGNTDHYFLVEMLDDAAWIAHCRGEPLAAYRYSLEYMPMISRLGMYSLSIQATLQEGILRMMHVGGDFPAAEAALAEFFGESIDRQPHPQMLADSLKHEAVLLAMRGSYSTARERLQRSAELQQPTPVTTAPPLLASLTAFAGDFAAARRLCTDPAFLPSPNASGAARMMWLQQAIDVYALIGDTEGLARTRREFEHLLDTLCISSEIHPDDRYLLCKILLGLGEDSRHEMRLNAWRRLPELREVANRQLAAAVKTAAAQQLLRQGDWQSAEPLAEESLQTCEAILGPGHTQTLTTLVVLARIRLAAGDTQQACQLVTDAEARRAASAGAEHPQVWLWSRERIRVLREAGRLDEAESLATNALARMREAMGNYHPFFADSAGELALTLAAQRRLDDMRALLEPLVAEVQATFPDQNVWRVWLELLLQLEARDDSWPPTNQVSARDAYETLCLAWGDDDLRTRYIAQQLSAAP